MSNSAPVTIHYLEMRSADQLRPAAQQSGLTVRAIDPPDGRVNRHFYETIGADFNWHEKLAWSDEQWQDYARRSAMHTWVGYLAEEQCGYFELRFEPALDVEIAMFGLLPDFVGRGLGGALLTAAISQAWISDAQRVWLHTCSDDHPAALANYQARGFEVYKSETHSD